MIELWCANQGMPPPATVKSYETQEAGVPMIDDDADVTVIAAHAARLAIDTLLARNPSQFPYSVYMIGLSQGWIFDQPFDTRPIDLGAPPETLANPIDPEQIAKEMSIVSELFSKRANATAAAKAQSDSAAT
jgi:hypothetical protein